MGNYKVYIHTNLVNNKVYIGITKQDVKKRWGNGYPYKRSPAFYNAIKKYGWNNFSHEVLYTNLTKQQASDKEKELIKLYQSNNNKYGYNIESGGISGKEISMETRKKLSINNGKYWLGKKLPESIKNKISETKKGTKYGNAIIKSRRVNQYDLNGKYIATYDTMTLASKMTSVPYQNISMCCRNIIHKTHNYIFKYSQEQ
jgi:group I intron endonuclease